MAKFYKRLEQQNSGCYAYKIVEAFDKLDDYKSQVRPLENEYRLVTSLEPHLRIIQFFTFVRDNSNARVMIIMEYLEWGY